MLRVWKIGVAVMAAMAATMFMSACQSPTDPDDIIGVDDFVEASVSPDPALAAESPDGKTYRVVRGNNQPDEILAYDWKTTFITTIRLNDQANDKDLDLAFPVDITAVSVGVKQASGGIVTPPTGGEIEHSEFLVGQSSGNRFAAANTANNFMLDVWYDLPSLRREALITVTIGLKDSENRAFTKTIDVKVAP
jgi:multisubunit Na+/H+ antiporter MnhF subunit